MATFDNPVVLEPAEMAGARQRLPKSVAGFERT